MTTGRLAKANPDGTLTLEAGDYGKARGMWFARPPGTPDTAIGNLSRHDITEHPDGTITVHPSISITYHAGEGNMVRWHGYLERGVWRVE